MRELALPPLSELRGHPFQRAQLFVRHPGSAQGTQEAQVRHQCHTQVLVQDDHSTAVSVVAHERAIVTDRKTPPSLQAVEDFGGHSVDLPRRDDEEQC